MAGMTREDVLEWMRSDLLTPLPCTQCGRPTSHRSVFMLNKPKEWGGSTNLQRGRVYALCAEHEERVVPIRRRAR
jgi:hypothetical protein